MSLPGIISILSAVGAAGGTGGVVISISPGDQAAWDYSSSYTFSAETATPSSGTPSSYTWSVSGYPGTWSVLAGQGTATATLRVTGVASGDNASGVVSCAVVVGGITYYGSAMLDYGRF